MSPPERGVATAVKLEEEITEQIKVTNYAWMDGTFFHFMLIGIRPYTRPQPTPPLEQHGQPEVGSSAFLHSTANDEQQRLSLA